VPIAHADAFHVLPFVSAKAFHALSSVSADAFHVLPCVSADAFHALPSVTADAFHALPSVSAEDCLLAVHRSMRFESITAEMASRLATQTRSLRALLLFAQNRQHSQWLAMERTCR